MFFNVSSEQDHKTLGSIANQDAGEWKWVVYVVYCDDNEFNAEKYYSSDYNHQGSVVMWRAKCYDSKGEYLDPFTASRTR